MPSYTADLFLNGGQVKTETAAIISSLGRMTAATQQAGQTMSGSLASGAKTGFDTTRRESEKATKSVSNFKKELTGSAARLNELAAAASGVMLGVSILQRQIIGIGFGLLFLGMTIPSLVLKIAALTVAIGGTAGLISAFAKLQIAATKAGMAFQDTGQRMANWLQSGKTAMEVMQSAEKVARTYRIPIDQARSLAFNLQKMGLNQEVYQRAMVNASAATGIALENLSQSFYDITRADASTRESLLKQFNKQLGMENKNYASSIDLANAINERFANSAAASATTASAALANLKNMWILFVETVGRVWQAVIGPIFDLFGAFIDGMRAGFQSAMDSAKATGELGRQLEDLRNVVRSILPYLFQVGVVIGRVIYQAVMLAVRGLKVLFTTLRSGLRWLKEFKDEAQAAGQSFKKNFLDVFTGPSVIAAAAIIGGLVALMRSLGTTVAKPLIKLLLPDIAKDLANFKASLAGFRLRSVYDHIAREFVLLYVGLTQDIQGLRAAIRKGAINLAWDIEDFGLALGAAFKRAAARLRRIPIVQDFEQTFRALGIGLRSLVSDLFENFGSHWDDGFARITTKLRLKLSLFAMDMVSNFKAFWFELLFELDRLATIGDKKLAETIINTKRLILLMRYEADGMIIGLKALLRKIFATVLDPTDVIQSFGDDFDRFAVKVFNGLVASIRRIGTGSAKLGLTVGREFVSGIFASIGPSIRNFATGGSRLTGLIDDAFRMIFTGFKFSLEVGKIIAKGLFTSIIEGIKGTLAGLKSGFLLAIFEVFTLTALDMLPIGEKLKESLNGGIRMAFLGAGIGIVFGPAGMVLGAAIGGLVSYALEQATPGASKAVMDWIDDTILSGIKKAGGGIKDGLDWLTGSNGVSDTAITIEMPPEAAQKDSSKIAKAFDVTTAAMDKMLAKMKDIGQQLEGPATRAWNAFERLMTDSVKPMLGELWTSMDKIWQILTTLEAKTHVFSGTLAVVLVAALLAVEFAFNVLSVMINTIVLPALRAINDVFDIIIALINGDWSAAWTATKQLLVDLMTLAIGPLLGLLDLFKTYTGVDISGGVTAGFDAIKSVGQTVLDWLRDDFLQFFIDLPGEIQDAFFGMKDGIANAFRSGLSGVIDVLNAAISAYNNTIGKIPGVPSIPKIDAGSWAATGGGEVNPPPIISWIKDAIDKANNTAGQYGPPLPAGSGVGDYGESFPTGGVVPGAPGQRRLVLAEAGERFLGAPGFGRTELGSGINITAVVNLPQSAIIVDRNSVRDLANMLTPEVANVILGKLGTGRNFTYHRAG